jgi:hypothetical protein
MMRSGIGSLCVVLVALCAQTQEKQSTKFKPRNMKVTGCLQAGSSENEVTITGEDGKKYELTSGRLHLKDHVGQKVQITGAERMEEGGVGLIRVSGLKMINHTCK